MASLPKLIYSGMLFWLLMSNTTEGELLVLPEGGIHNILCTAPAEDHYAINWGTSRDGEVEDAGIFTVGEEETVGEGMKGRQVIFNATSLMNSTILRCVVINFDQPSSSPEPLEFIIIIQGVLSAPDVEYAKVDESIMFMWSPPFSHNITDVEPDISHYLVNIYSGDTPTFTVNTTETNYILHTRNCEVNELQVEIAAVNVVGVGDKYTSPYFSLEAIKISNCTTNLGGDFPVLLFQIHTNCHEEIVYYVELIPTFSRRTLNISNTTIFGQTTLTVSSEEIEFNEHYKATVRIRGMPTLTRHLTLSTFDVQGVVVREYSGHVHIECHFALRSNKDCKIFLSPYRIMSKQRDTEYVYTASRTPGSSEAAAVIVLPNGNYTVKVFDGEPETEYPAYSTLLTISHSQLKDTKDVNNDTREEVGENDCQCHCSLSVTVLAMGLAVLTVILTITSTFTLLFIWKKNRKKDYKSAEKQDKYVMDDNPVYMIHTRTYNIKTTSTPSHVYDTVGTRN